MTTEDTLNQPNLPQVSSVPSTAYDERYYWESDGPGSWRRFLERAPKGDYGDGGYLLRLAQIKPGNRVLDVGCGRGEAILRCVQLDDVTAVGVDYSEAAVSIAQEIVYEFGRESQKKRMLFVRADAQCLPFADHSFDVILSHHVVEHLYPQQQYAMLKECHRLLRREGRLIIETAPNLWRLRYGFPITRLAYRLHWMGVVYRRSMGMNSIPMQSKSDNIAMYHVGELSVLSLRKLLRRTGFDCRVWVGLDESGIFSMASFRKRFGAVGIVLRGVYRALYETYPFNLVFGDVIYADARPADKA